MEVVLWVGRPISLLIELHVTSLWVYLKEQVYTHSVNHDEDIECVIEEEIVIKEFPFK